MSICFFSSVPLSLLYISSSYSPCGSLFVGVSPFPPAGVAPIGAWSFFLWQN